MCHMCQMLNIWHTKHHLTSFIRCVISHIFCNILQQSHKFATVRNACGIWFILFYSSFSLISPLVSHGKPQSSPLKPQPSLLFHANANDHFHADVDDYFHAETNADLSLATIFLFFFFFLAVVWWVRFRQRWVGSDGLGYGSAMLVWE